MDNPKPAWFSSPVFPGDEEKTAQARTINTIQIYFLLALVCAAVLVPFLVHQCQVYYALILILFVINVISRIIMFTGRLKLASTFMIATGWVLFGWMAIVSNGIASPLMFAILATTTVSGMLISRRIGMLFVVVSVVAGLVLVAVQHSGVVLPVIFPLSQLVTWLMFALATLFIHGFTSLVVRNLQDALKRERLLSEAYRNANATLQASEARFRTLAENAQDLIYRYRLGDTPGFEYVSPSATRLTGYTPEEHYTDPQLGFKLIHPDDRPALEAITRLSVEPSRPLVLRWIRKDGSILWVEQKNTPILGPDGKIIAIEGSAADITERMMAGKALSESELRFRTLSDNAVSGVYIIQFGCLKYVNSAMAEIFGYSTEELTGMDVLQLIHPEDRNQVGENIRRRLAGEITTIRYETRGRRKNGELIDIEILGSRVDMKGIPTIIGNLADITGRKQAEERIQQSEKKYRELFQVNKDGISIFLLDPQTRQGTFIELNEAAHRMLGYTAEEMLALSPLELEPGVTQGQTQFRQIELESHGSVTFETALRHKDGHTVFAEFTSQMIQYQGRPAVMNIVRDITERKQHELELQAIATLSSALRTASTRTGMLPVLVENIADLYKANAISVEIIDPDTGDAVVEAAFGRWESIFGYRQKQGTGFNAIISRTLQPYLTQFQNESSQPEWLFGSVRCAAGVPLIAQEKLIGFLWIGRDNEIAPTEVRMLAAIADIAANAIHRATLHEEALQAARDLSAAYDTTLDAWARALELRDQETEEHSRRVKEMTLQLARLYGMDDADLIQIRRGATLHDIGKIGIPDAILRKPGPLSADEWETMYKHPRVAYDLLAPIRHLHPALDIPYCHHEKWDGSGYPRGLKGEEIPLAARIFAIVDVWDALRSDRPYRQKWPVEKVRDYIRSQSGIHFDPKIVELFLEMVGEGS